MSTPSRVSVKPISNRLFVHPNFWIWMTILLSILVTGSVSWLRFRQQQMLQLATTRLESIRLARIDLSKGFLYATLAGDPGSPFDQDAGLVLINQAIISLDRTLSDLGPASGESAVAFHESAGAFQDALSEWAQATTTQPDKAAKLRIAFRELEYRAGEVDAHTQQDLNRLSDRLDSEFTAALGVSAFMLAGICGIVFLAGRAKEEYEAALRESELRYRELVQNANSVIIRWTRDGTVLFFNEYAQTLFGYSSEEIVGKNVGLLTPERESTGGDLTNLLKDIIAHPERFVSSINENICRDGRRVWMVWTNKPIFDENGQVTEILAVGNDITRRRQAEEALRESEERYRHITQTLTDYIYTVRVADGQAVETTHGPACAAVTGYTSEDFAANPDLWLQMVVEEDRPAVLEQVGRLLNGQDAQPVEHRITRKDGVKRWVRNTPVPHLDSTGKLLSYDGLIQDITERKQMEEALRESEERYRIISGLTSDVTYAIRIEPDGTTVSEWWAGAYARISGFTPDDLEARGGLLTILHPDDRPIAPQHLQVHLAGQSTVAEYRIITKSGEVRWLLDYGYPVWDEAQKRVVRIIGAAQDITERKRADEALRTSEEKYRLLFQSNPVPMWVYDTGSLAFLAVNDFAVDHYGYSREEFLNMTIRDIRPPEDIPYLYEVLNKYTGEVRKVGAARHRRKDGSLIDVDLTGHELEFDGRQAMLVLAMDITERKRAENLLRAQRDLALALGATSNLEKGLRLCLNTALLLSGMDGGGVYRIDEVSGALSLAVHQGLSSRFVATISRYEADSPNAQLVMAGKPVYTEHMRLGIPLNKVKQRESLRALAVIPIRHEDQVIGCLNVTSYTTAEVPEFARDALETIAAQMGDVIVHMKAEAELRQYRDHLEELVEQRTAEIKTANERLLVLTREKDEFVSNVSHELRTPIASLKLRQRLLKSHPEHLAQHLDVLQRETDRLARTIEDLLQLSRLDQRRVEFHPVSIDLNDLAGQYVVDRLPIANDRGLELSFQGESDLPDVIADAGLLGQALSTLITNAVNYTPAGGQVFVRTHVRYEADRQWVGFSVADTGPGISPEERPQLFDRFFRGGAGHKSGVPGTGLGLSIAREIIHRHRGHIEVESDGVPGHGATFKAWIPIGENANDQSASSG